MPYNRRDDSVEYFSSIPARVMIGGYIGFQSISFVLPSGIIGVLGRTAGALVGGTFGLAYSVIDNVISGTINICSKIFSPCFRRRVIEQEEQNQEQGKTVL